MNKGERVGKNVRGDFYKNSIAVHAFAVNMKRVQEEISEENGRYGTL